MGLDQLPDSLRDLYEVHEWKHACAVLERDFPTEWKDICSILGEFRLSKADILTPGGRKSAIANRVDKAFEARGWREKSFETEIVIDSTRISSPTHSIDCFRNGIGLEIEWNNKDPFYDQT